MEGARIINSIRLQNILSYGPNTPAFPLEPLNVLIGPNASGKSNLIEALSILAAAPRDIQEPLRGGGGVEEWLWKGSQDPLRTASMEILVDLHWAQRLLRYRLSFGSLFSRFALHGEMVEGEPYSGQDSKLKFYYQYRDGQPVERTDGEFTSEVHLKREDLKSDQSILSQMRLPGLSTGTATGVFLLAGTCAQMRLYRELPLWQEAPIRRPQQADLPQDYLWEDGSNFAVVLSFLLNQPRTKEWLLHNLQDFYPSVRDIQAVVLGGSVQVSFHEEGLGHPVPATRLSDGSLRYLFLLAALCSLEPPPITPIICIEEPETGLHPDVIPKLAKLLVEASKRSQIIVTTHSDILIDALSDTPEAVVICEKVDGATQLRRLDADDLKVWLDDYRLGELWTRGDLGGNVW